MADIVCQYGTEYLKKYDEHILPSHRKVMQHITSCRTPAMGGQKFLCQSCGTVHYSYHSCRNRHCPKCQNDRIDDWLEGQFNLLLSVPYFMATVTVPDILRPVFRSHQKTMYHLFFKAASEALMLLAKAADLDPTAGLSSPYPFPHTRRRHSKKPVEIQQTRFSHARQTALSAHSEIVPGKAQTDRSL